MPLISKKRHRSPSPNGSLPKSKKSNESYMFMDNIGYSEDHHHALYRNIPESTDQATEHIARNVVSFLNGDGGILTYGVRPNGKIYGERITRREQDVLTNSSIDAAIKRVLPYVEGELYIIDFIDVLGAPMDYNYKQDKDNQVLKIVRIKVSQGRPYELYEDTTHGIYQRRGTTIYGPYTPHDIKEHTIKQLKEQIRSNEKLLDVLDTPPPRKKSGNTVKTTSSGVCVTSVDKRSGEGHKTLVQRAMAPRGRSPTRKIVSRENNQEMPLHRVNLAPPTKAQTAATTTSNKPPLMSSTAVKAPATSIAKAPATSIAKAPVTSIAKAPATSIAKANAPKPTSTLGTKAIVAKAAASFIAKATAILSCKVPPTSKPIATPIATLPNKAPQPSKPVASVPPIKSTATPFIKDVTNAKPVTYLPGKPDGNHVFPRTKPTALPPRINPLARVLPPSRLAQLPYQKYATPILQPPPPPPVMATLR